MVKTRSTLNAPPSKVTMMRVSTNFYPMPWVARVSTRFKLALLLNIINTEDDLMTPRNGKNQGKYSITDPFLSDTCGWSFQLWSFHQLFQLRAISFKMSQASFRAFSARSVLTSRMLEFTLISDWTLASSHSLRQVLVEYLRELSDS